MSTSRKPGLGRAACLVLPWVLLSVREAAAQEALSNELRQDAAARLRALPPEARPPQDILRIGPVTFDVGVRYTIEASDNISYAEVDRESEFIQRPSLSIGLDYPVTPNSSLSFGVAFGYIDYIRNTSEDRFFIAPDSALAYDLRFGNTWITIYDRFDYTQDVATEGGLTGISDFPRFQNVVGLRAGWRGERWSVQGGYGHMNIFSMDEEFEYINRADELFFARVGLHYPSSLEVGLEGSATLSNYALDTENDRQNYSVGPYVSRVFGPVRVSVRGGLSYSVFEASTPLDEDSDLTSYYFGATVEHDLTAHISHGLTIFHGIGAGFTSGGDYIESTDLTYYITWAFLDHARMGVGVFGEIGEENAIDSGSAIVSEEYYRVGASLDVVYDLTERISLLGRYAFTKRDSDVPLRSYYENRITLGVSYRF
jgi:hypothetical protein